MVETKSISTFILLQISILVMTDVPYCFGFVFLPGVAYKNVICFQVFKDCAERKIRLHFNIEMILKQFSLQFVCLVPNLLITLSRFFSELD